MKRFNFALYSLIALSLVVLAFFSFNAAFSRDERTLSNNVFSNFLADLFNIFMFPAHILLPGLTSKPFYFAVGLVANCLFYGLLVERSIFYVATLIFKDDSTSEE